VATKKTDRAWGELQDVDGRKREAVARTEVVEILAAAVLELLVARRPDPSPDWAHTPRKAQESAVSLKIRVSE
jgi:hypothetical protein